MARILGAQNCFQYFFWSTIMWNQKYEMLSVQQLSFTVHAKAIY